MRVFYFFCLLFVSVGAFAQSSSPRDLMLKMVTACEENRSGKFTLHSVERLINGKITESSMIVKYQVKPKKLYLLLVDPNAGTEVLFREGEVDDKMLINPSGFPFVNLKLSPFSSLVRRDNHHTIYQIGFDYISSMIRYYLNVYGENFYNYLSIKDTINWDHHTCIHMVCNFKEFETILYTVKVNETLTTIAEKYHLNDYSILVLNPTISDFHKVHAGQIIQIPNFYNRRVDFYVDTVTFLPLIQEIHDSKGMFERYELKSFIANPSFAPDEFTPEFSEYSF